MAIRAKFRVEAEAGGSGGQRRCRSVLRAYGSSVTRSAQVRGVVR